MLYANSEHILIYCTYIHTYYTYKVLFGGICHVYLFLALSMFLQGQYQCDSADDIDNDRKVSICCLLYTTYIYVHLHTHILQDTLLTVNTNFAKLCIHWYFGMEHDRRTCHHL